MQVIELGVLRVPLHTVFLKKDNCAGNVKVAVCSKIPVAGVLFILGNA